MSRTQAILFDLDGVLTDTAELHYRSWQQVADQLSIPFDRVANEALRGLSREESLVRVLGRRISDFSAEQQADISRRKNDLYVTRVAQMSATDLFPGARELLNAAREAGFKLAVASSSRNAHRVLDCLGIRTFFDAIVDGVDAPRSKPDPLVFQTAARRVGATPDQCVVVEDAESGVAAGLAAGMRVIGLGPAERVGRAHLVRKSIADLRLDDIQSLFEASIPSGNRF